MKARCRQCEYLNQDCGLHGRARVDPDGEQPDLNHHGGCGFNRATEPRQYNLFLDNQT